MIRAFFSLYKIPLILAIVLAIILVSFTVETRLSYIVMITIGTLLGALIMDLDYFIHAYVVETDSDFSRTLRAYVDHRDFRGALNFVNVQKDKVKEKTLNSGLFQMCLIALLFLVFYSEAHIIIKALILSMYANSIYKFAENFYLHQTFSDWFWFLRGTPQKQWISVYTIGLVFMLLYFIYYF
jgi:hypothetical protein